MNDSIPEQTIAFATKHGKERQFGPALSRSVGVDVVVAGLDTDQLGTFTGEVQRPADQLETARRKARWAIDYTGSRYGLSSEGPFGPHPQIPFVAAGLEVAVFIDSQEGVEVVERLWCTDTNFAQLTISDPSLPEAFLDRVGFPSHALIVSTSRDQGPFLKGMQHRDELRGAIATSIDTHDTAFVQTDMRAHLNPARQRCLHELAERLSARLLARCPGCAARGWGVVDYQLGLPCEWCGSQTELIAAEVFGCARSSCTHEETKSRQGLASPASCPRCNP